MPQDGEKFSGKPFPVPANPGSLVCFMIEIPDDIKYRAALLGQIGWLADWRAWRHSDVDYVTEIPEVNIEIAGLFARALLDSSFGECMDCEGVALCIVESETVQAAIAGAISQSLLIQQAIIQQVTNYGSGLPGQQLTEQQAQIDTLPTNVRTGDVCDNNALWGACLYLTQSANRAIEDFFQQIETLTNPIERGQLAATAVPAVGDWIVLVPGFVEQVAEELSEGYTAAYTEALEQQIACQMFCAARLNCELSIEQIVDIFAADLGDLDIADFGVVLTFLTTGVLVGEQIVYAGFLLYFTALKFGQQFGAVLGIRPLTDLMGLGADYLASDNWETLCDCPIECDSYNFVTSSYFPTWRIRLNGSEPLGEYSAGVGYIARAQTAGGYQNQIYTLHGFGCSTLQYVYSAVSMPSQVALFWCNADFSVLSLAVNLTAGTGTVTDTVDLSSLTPPPGATGFLLVSGDATSPDNVATWLQANFS